MKAIPMNDYIHLCVEELMFDCMVCKSLRIGAKRRKDGMIPSLIAYF